MNKQIKALKQAIEAMTWDLGGEPLPSLELKAIQACKEALELSEKQHTISDKEQPAQPDYKTLAIQLQQELAEIKNKPAQQQEPTDEQIEAWIETHGYYGHCTTEYYEGLEEGAKWMREQRTIKESLNVEALNEIKRVQEYLDAKMYAHAYLAAESCKEAILKDI